MKKIVKALLSLLVLTLFVINPQSIKAQEVTSKNGLYEYEPDYYNGTCTLTKCMDMSANLVIPAKIDGLKVTEIDFMFGGNSTYDGEEHPTKSVVIPDTVTVIDGMAFQYCCNLEKVTFSKNLKVIGFDAFRGTAIKELTIGAGVTNVEGNAFSECPKLATVVIKGKPAFGENVFFKCQALKTVSAPKLEKTGVTLFASCTKLKSASMPNLKEIARGTFDGCTSLKSFKIGKKVTLIDAYAFSGSGIKSVTLPEGLLEIGERAFFDTKIPSIIIPLNCNKLGAGAFEGIKNLKLYIKNGSENYPSFGTYGILEMTDQTATIFATKGSSAQNYAKNHGRRFVAIKGIGKITLKETDTKKGTKVTLSWKKVSGVKGYTVYRSKHASNKGWGAWKKVKTVKKNKYSEIVKDSVTDYKYKVVYTGSYKKTKLPNSGSLIYGYWMYN